jgi:hypothetical protein
MGVIFCGPVIRPLLVLDDNLACATTGEHNVAAYVAAMLLYRANDGTIDDNAA